MSLGDDLPKKLWGAPDLGDPRTVAGVFYDRVARHKISVISKARSKRKISYASSRAVAQTLLSKDSTIAIDLRSTLVHRLRRLT